MKHTQKKLNSKANKNLHKLFLFAAGAVCVCVLGAVIILGAAAIGIFDACIDTAPDVSASDIVATGQSSFVYDSEGNQIAKLVASNSNRISVTLDEVPEDLQHAFVAIEDSRFYEHNGIDIIGIIRAVVSGVRNGFNFTSGASTITQQLIKNTVFEDFVNESTLESITRKIQEWYLAIKLSNELSKDEVLIRYLNTINLGQNCLGVQAASLRYFNKDVSELTLSECAVIATITKSPSGYNPIKNPEKNAERREEVLDSMLEQGYITQAEYDEAMADDPYTRIQAVNELYTSEDSVTSYFVDAVTDQVYDDLVEAGYTESEAYSLLYSGGITINTTLIQDIQDIVDEVVNDESNYAVTYYELEYALSVTRANGDVEHFSTEMMQIYLKEIGYSENGYSTSSPMLFASEEAADAAIAVYQESVLEEGDEILAESITLTLEPQTSVCIIDQSTGYVVALSGGRGEKTVSKAFNRATDATRQPGSCFKVLSAYAPTLDNGYTLADTIMDSAFAYTNAGNDSDNRLVSNWWTGGYRGLLSLRYGIQWSANVVTVKLLTMITPRMGMDYLLNFGFTTLLSETDENGNTDVTQALCLGGITNGVTNLELTAAYASIANGGTYIEPTLYTTVLDSSGNVILDRTSGETRQTVKDTTAWLLIDAMRDCASSGTGTRANFSGQDVAVKTGTTSDNLDVWVSGFTGYYTCSIWLGYDNNNKSGGLSSSETKTHLNMWNQIMSQIHDDLDYETIMEKPEDIVQVQVCSKSGKLPIAGVCDGCVTTEYFAAGTEPTEYCDVHWVGWICNETGLPATDYCPNATYGICEVLPLQDESLWEGLEAAGSSIGGEVTYCYHTYDYMMATYGYAEILHTNASAAAADTSTVTEETTETTDTGQDDGE
ncbi:MAG: transglycosylase domain-containing protein [Lachnospiraceae bacterium]|nr:transglycosylase domain-containing protein [Lachnospiraceae bacterium]